MYVIKIILVRFGVSCNLLKILPVFLPTSWYIVLIKHTIYYEYNNNYFCCKRE